MRATRDFAPPARFRILRELGEGGMGVVYEAFDSERSATVALKTIRRATPDALARFKQEFRVMQDLHHPNLVNLGELVSDGDQWFFTMELVQGGDFLAYVKATSAPPSDSQPESSDLSPEAIALAETKSIPLSGLPPLAPAPFDEERLRRALSQLVGALGALHAAGLVHRDLKPANVRVTPQGRVVLLDFGLVADAGDEHDSTGLNVVGTPAYMAPEQAAGKVIGPEADLYALGVMLYEALSGRLPIDGSPLELLLRKQKERPVAPSTLAPNVPPDLDILCGELLRFDPAARPRGPQILRRLGAPSSVGAMPLHSQTPLVPFVGRTSELDALAQAFRDSRARAVVVLLSGESGVGKSCLAKHFAAALSLEDRDLVVLAGRCYEREVVPYKGFDGVIDALSRFLRKLPSSETGHFLPTRPAPLAQVFPVLRRVRAVAEILAGAGPSAPLDAPELRTRAFAALRDLLTRLTDRRPLLLVIDDIQWTDADSLALLADLLRPPDAPRLLLLATVRTTPKDPAEGGARVTSALVPIGVEVRSLALPRLSIAQGHELASMLLARGGLDSGIDPEAIAEEAEGHPLFIDALVRHAVLVDPAALGSVRLEDALWSRVQRLDASAREVVELVSVAGAPVMHDVLAGAMDEMDRDVLAENVALLRVAHLVSITGARGTDTVEPYHDRVRGAVLSHLSDESKRARHRRLAVAHEAAGGTDLEALSLHWRGAGEELRAADYAERAGDRSAAALAFDHAAALYEMALTLGGESRPGRAALQEKVGSCYANAGRAAHAATAYRAAARDLNAARALDLNRRAADQLLRGGHFQEGLASASEVLRSIGFALPGSPFAALCMLVFWRIRLRIRGLGFRAREESAIAPEELARVDTFWSVAYGLAFADNIVGAAFSTRHLALALRTGEKKRIARALSLELGYVVSTGASAWKRGDRLGDRAMALARETSDSAVLGLATNAVGFARVLQGRYADALPLIERGLQILTQCHGVAFEVATAQVYEITCLCLAGELQEVNRRVPRYLRDAADRGDLFATVNLGVGPANLRWLAANDPGAARRAVAEAMSQWPSDAFHVEHLYELNSLARIDLYEGDPASAHARFGARWAALEASMLLRVMTVRAETYFLRSSVALTLAKRGHVDATSLVRLAVRDARKLESEEGPLATSVAHSIRAGIASVQGRDGDAIRELRLAIPVLQASGLQLIAEGARRALGRLIGGVEGDAMVRSADDALRAKGVKDPERMCLATFPFAGTEHT